MAVYCIGAGTITDRLGQTRGPFRQARFPLSGSQ
nr:MAG TPA: hypothetical protein [Caudoviricetes sp.]